MNESECRHCGDPIGTNERGEWVDENGLSSCAPIAPRHEPLVADQPGCCTVLDQLPLHRTKAGTVRCATCDGGGCPDCTDPAH